MPRPFTEELVTTTTEDGLLLNGVVIRPSGRPRRAIPIVWVHGLTGTFYGRSTTGVGRALAALGYTVVAGNNRGHDFGALLPRPNGEPLLAGGGWERFDQCIFDVAAWIGVAAGLGFPGVVLAGHSLGALKVGYYQATRSDPRVRGLVAASAPVRAGELNLELVAMAERLVSQADGRDLLGWGATQAGAGTVSAQTYLNRATTNVDVYGFVTPNPRVALIRCPILAFYGSEEPNVGGPAQLEAIRLNATASPWIETQMIEGADHSYLGHEGEVAALIARFAIRIGRMRAAAR